MKVSDAARNGSLMTLEAKWQERKVLELMGWGPIQAEAIAAGMDGIPSWKPEWLGRMRDHCSASERHGLNCQASFLTWMLTNAHEQIGIQLRAAETIEQAHEALRSLWDAMHATR